MLFNTGAALLDAIVLAVVAREPEGTYGYKITQEAGRSFIYMKVSGAATAIRSRDCLKEN